MARKKQSSRRKSIGKRITKQLNAVTESIENNAKSVSNALVNAFAFLGTLLIPKALTKRLEKASSKTSSSVGKKVGKATEKLEKQFSKGASGISSVFGFILQIIVPKPVAKWFSARSKAVQQWFSKFFRRLGKTLGALAEKYLPQWLVNLGKRFSKQFRKNLRATSKFSTAWRKSRNYLALAWSTPVFLLGIPLFFFLAIAAIQDSYPLIARYSFAMQEALENQEFAKANLYREKISQLGYQNLENVDYTKAISLAETNIQDAYEAMLKLAPLGDTPSAKPSFPGNEEDPETSGLATEQFDFAPAHIWIASQLLSDERRARRQIGDQEGQIKLPNPSLRLQLAEQHAKKAYALDNKNTFPRYLEARCLLMTDKRDEAIEAMEEAAYDFPVLAGELMAYYGEIGNQNRANSMAKKYDNYWRREVYSKLTAYLAKLDSGQLPTNSDPQAEEASDTTEEVNGVPVELSKDEWVLWVTALERLRKFEKAGEVARVAGRQYSDDPKIRDLAIQVVMAELRDVKPRTPEEAQLLREAHELDPENTRLIQVLADRLVYHTELVQTHLAQMRANKTVAPAVFLKAAEMWFGQQEYENVVRCCEFALEVDSQCDRAQNNIAWVRSNVEPLQLEAALQAVNEAIKIDPQAGYYETRGQIHYKLKDFQRAASDLERAINGRLPDQDLLNSHQTLSKIYRQLGKSEQAAAHATRARNVRQRMRS